MTRAKTSRATALPIEAIALRSKPDREDDRGDGSDQEPRRGPPAEPAAQQRRELADRRHLLTQSRRGIQPGVRRPSGREQGGDAHQPVAGPARASGSAATARAVPPDAITSSTVSVPKTPSATAT